jgi:hypothetical protein
MRSRSSLSPHSETDRDPARERGRRFAKTVYSTRTTAQKLNRVVYCSTVACQRIPVRRPRAAR